MGEEDSRARSKIGAEEEGEGMKQFSWFDGGEEYKIDKPLRLIELFAGYGSQNLALKYLGIPHESWRISEWAVNSILAYKDLHHPDDETDYSQGMTDIIVMDEKVIEVQVDDTTLLR